MIVSLKIIWVAFLVKRSYGTKSIMLAGHLDEIGFIVTKIDNEGFIKFQPIGGWWSQVMLSQK